jgi:hypothetical protein
MTYRASLHSPHRAQWAASSCSEQALACSRSGWIVATCPGAAGDRSISRIGPTSFRRHQFGECDCRITLSIPTINISKSFTDRSPPIKNDEARTVASAVKRAAVGVVKNSHHSLRTLETMCLPLVSTQERGAT